MNSSLTPELFRFIPFMVDDERTILLQLPLGPTVAMAAIIAISIVWSNAMKVYIYHSLAQEKLADRPINVLILVDQVTFELPSLIFSKNVFPSSSLVPVWAGGGLFHQKRPPASPTFQFLAPYAVHFSKQRRHAMSEGI